MLDWNKIIASSRDMIMGGIIVMGFYKFYQIPKVNKAHMDTITRIRFMMHNECVEAMGEEACAKICEIYVPMEEDKK